MSTAISAQTTARNRYVPCRRNEPHPTFEQHFDDFCARYDERYAATYGRYSLERIQQIGERFCTCGEYLQGVARIRCTNPECGHDFLRPFSCTGFYLYPSCSRKRTILFIVHLTNDFLLKLLVHRGLLNEDFAQALLSWKHSGFTIDNSVRILDDSSQESLAAITLTRPETTPKLLRPAR